MPPATSQPHVAPRLRRTHALARRWFSLALDLVFPPVCACCRKAIEPGAPFALCAPCRAALVDTRPACPRCAAPVPSGLGTGQCPRCRGERLYYEGAVRLGPYQGLMRTAVLRTKRPFEQALAAALGDLMADVAGASLALQKPDLVVPVPMHWTRKVWRGANCPQTIARRLALHLHIPARPDLLARRRRTAPQTSLSPNRRRANVRGAFQTFHDLAAARIVLVDDIMTSGATVNEAAKTLRKAGAAFITVAVCARAEGLA
jgi:ComF family protein